MLKRPAAVRQSSSVARPAAIISDSSVVEPAVTRNNTPDLIDMKQCKRWIRTLSAGALESEPALKRLRSAVSTLLPDSAKRPNADAIREICSSWKVLQRSS